MDDQTQRLIEDVKYEIQDLIQVMKNLGVTFSAIGDQELDRLKALKKGEDAIQSSIIATNENNKVTQNNTRLVDQYGQAIESSTEAVEDDTKARRQSAAESRKAAKDEIDARREALVYRRNERSSFLTLSEEMGSTRLSMSRLQERFMSGARGHVGMESAIQLATAAVRGFADGLTGMARSLYAGQQGAAVAGKAMNEFAGTMGTAMQGVGLALTLLPGLGIAARALGLALSALGITAKAAGEAVEEMTRMSDRVFISYVELSRSGITAADGMLGLARSAQELGYGLDEIGMREFGQLLAQSSQNLAIMAGSAVEGRRRLLEFGNLVRDEIGEDLMSLGLLPNQINEGVTAFLNDQVRIGRAARMTNEELRQGSIRYIKEMDILAKLTGQQAKDIQSRMDQDLREERFRAGLMRVEREMGVEAADTLRKNLAALGAQYPELAAGLKDITSGFINTEAASKLFRSGIQQVPPEMMQQLGGGFNQLFRTVGDNARVFGETLGAVGAFNSTFGSLDEQIRAGQQAQFDYNKNLYDVLTQQTRQIAAADPAVQAQVELRRSQMQVRDSLQDLILSGVEPVTGAMSDLSGVVRDTVTGIENLLSKITFGAYKPAPTMGNRSAGAAAPARGMRAGTSGAVAAGATQYGAAGAALGAVLSGPAAPIGAAIGGGVGAVVGGVAGYFGRGVAGVETPAETQAQNQAAEKNAAQINKILNFIGRVESGGKYDMLVGGKRDTKILNMTVAEILKYQSTMRQRGHESTAIGKYQIIKGTLESLVAEGVVSPRDKFDSTTQDKLAAALLRRRGYDRYATGRISKQQFANNLAGEWASLPRSDGRSAYSGVGSNKALVSYPEVLQAISAQRGGVARGPTSGYAAVLHGTEAIVPLPDGRSIPVEINTTADIKNVATSMGQELRHAMRDMSQKQIETDATIASLLGQMVSLQRANNALTERLYQVTAN